MTTKQGHILLHKNLQLKFMGQENEQLREKVENLQKMVKVNKEIMSSLLQQECQNSMSQSTSADTQATQKLKNNIDLLGERNAMLEKKIEAEQADKLVLECIIQDMKNQEDTIYRNHEVEKSALQANIDRKEYTLQTVELKVYHYEKYL